MEFLRSIGLWWIAVPVVIGLIVARRRIPSQPVDIAGSTLSPHQDSGSWDMTAALPMCPECDSPMVLRNARGRSQAWSCPTPGCKGAQ